MHKSLAFSLVELSIVLVILGLLTGGILAGQSLIRASELRSVSTQLQRLNGATQAFRDKYFALPGDMANATKFWGAETTCPSTDRTAKTLTCNGNGDGQIAWDNESFSYWQHLANAGLIEGSYWGVAGPGAVYDHICGSNAPASRLGGNTCWRVLNFGSPPASDPAFFAGDYGNVFQLGMQVVNTWPTGNVLKPEEMWNIDVKMDDGRPGYGQIVSGENYTYCHNAPYAGGADPAVAEYRLDNPNAGCILIFKKVAG